MPTIMSLFERFVVLLLLLSSATPVDIFADDNMMPVESHKQLTGCWMRVVFSQTKMKEMNTIGEPWTNPHQWFCFTNDGSFNMKTSNKTETETSLKTIFKNLPTLNQFEVLQPGIVKTSHKERKKDTIFWNSAILKRSLTIENTTMPPGTILMTILHPKTKQPVYYRFLTKLSQS
jgi:hypothetical protein